jgi:hypothetical protein
MEEDHDFVLAYLRQHNIKLTRANYLSIAFLGDDVPDDLEVQFPDGLVDDFVLNSEDFDFLRSVGIAEEA